LLLRLYALEVDLRHVNLFSPELAHAVQDRPADLLPLFETAATRAAKNILFPIQLAGARGDAGAGDGDQEIPSIQIMVKSGLNLLQFRDLTVRYTGPCTLYLDVHSHLVHVVQADTLTKMVRIPGIVISTSHLQSRATKLHLQCRACRSPKIITAPPGLGGVGGGFDRGLPRVCDA
jgi:DNA replication licensing factor MCM5